MSQWVTLCQWVTLSRVDSTKELAAIFLRKAQKRGLEVSGHAEAALPGLLDAHFPAKIRALWNAGLADRLLSEAVQCLNARLDPCSATREQLSTLELCDVGAAGTLPVNMYTFFIAPRAL